MPGLGGGSTGAVTVTRIRYFGIRRPEEGTIWWLGASQHDAWMSFFQWPPRPHRAPLTEAIKAYEAIGYRCIELTLTEIIQEQ